MQMVYAGEPMPEQFSRSIFLAGPTPRRNDVGSWRPRALEILKERGYDGVVFVPEDRAGSAQCGEDGQIEWEHSAFNHSDCALFWVPRELEKMPAFTTNIEFGWLWHSGWMVFGCPDDAPKTGYMKHCAGKEFVLQANTLEGTVDAALRFLGDGSHRSGGARQVPLFVWRTKAFQSWYQAQHRAGHVLEGVELKATFRVGDRKERVYIWMIHPRIRIFGEGRMKTNEPVIGRLDTSAVVLYRRGPTLLDYEVVIGREFRSSARNNECFVWELPAGSNPNPAVDPLDVAVEEVHEETGFVIGKERLKSHGPRQLAATLLTHCCNLFSAELTDEEMNWFKSQVGEVHGADMSDPTGERVYTQVCTIREIFAKDLVDWSTIGMILSALKEA